MPWCALCKYLLYEVIDMKYYCNRRNTGKEYGGENCKAVKSAEDNKKRLMEVEKKSEEKKSEKKKATENKNENKSKNKFKNNSDEDVDDNDIGLIIPPGCSKEYMEDYLDGSGVSVKIYTEDQSENYNYSQTNSKSSKSISKERSYNPERDAVRYYMPNNQRKNEIGLYGNTANNISDNMSGRYNLLSVPDLTQNMNNDENKNRKVSLSAYLDNYRGKFICLDLWTVQQNRIEKCGVLEEIGADFLAIRNSRGGIMLIDLKSVRYISVFCR